MKLAHFTLLMGLFLSAMILPTMVRGETARRFALIVSSNDGGITRSRLRYANQDARSFAAALQNLAGVSQSDMSQMADANRQKVLDKLKSIATTVQTARPERSQFIFYYSGHSDEEGLLLGNERISYAELKKLVAAVPVQTRIFILDSCSSGALTLSKGGTRQQPFLTGSTSQSEGYAIITSSSIDEFSQESDRLKGSFFTHFLLSGMRGAADANKDHLVTLSEVYQYAFQETLQNTARTKFGAQHPNYDFQLKGRGDVILTDLRVLSSKMVFGPGLDGDFYIKSQKGSIAAELTKKPGTRELLALEAGFYEVIRHAGERYSRALLELTENQTTHVDALPFSSVPSEAVRARGNLDIPEIYDSSILYFSLWPSSYDPQSGRLRRYTNLHLSPLVGYIPRLFGLGIGLAGHLSDEADGLVLSLGFAHNTGSFYGIQAALAMSSTDTLRGLQISGINSAQAVKGGQIGLINDSERLSGLQIGMLNVARNIEGFQMGLINIADTIEGFSLAPILYVRDGLLRSEIWTDSLGFLYLDIRSGTHYYYSGFHIGMNAKNRSAGLSFGLRLPLGADALCVDYGLFIDNRKEVIENDSMENGRVGRWRAFYEWRWREKINLLVGVSQVMQYYTNPNLSRLKPLPFLSSGSTSDSGDQRIHRGFMLGGSYSLNTF
jgi:hypothetical protein